MKKICSFLILFALMTFSHSLSHSMAQQSTGPVLQPSAVDIRQVLISVSPLIEVEYQSGSIIVLKADEDTLLLSNGTVTPFWHAIDIVKSHGYTLSEVTTSGMGSQGNPTRFYAIMTKP